MKNRVQEIYEVAVKFLSLPVMSRFMIGTHFGAGGYQNFVGDEFEAAVSILRIAYIKDFGMFKNLVEGGYTREKAFAKARIVQEIH